VHVYFTSRYFERFGHGSAPKLAIFASIEQVCWALHLLETKEKLVVATQGVLKLEVGQTSGWIRPKIAYTTSISCPAGQDKSSVSNSQATSSMAGGTTPVPGALLVVVEDTVVVVVVVVVVVEVVVSPPTQICASKSGPMLHVLPIPITTLRLRVCVPCSPGDPEQDVQADHCVSWNGQGSAVVVVVDVVERVVVVDPVTVPVAEVVVGADVVVVQPSQMIASTLSSMEQVVPVPTITSLDRYLVPVPESPQPTVHSLHSVQSVSSSSQGQSKLLHASSSISIPFVQELPLPLTTCLERCLVPPAHVAVHGLHSSQPVPM